MSEGETADYVCLDALHNAIICYFTVVTLHILYCIFCAMMCREISKSCVISII